MSQRRELLFKLVKRIVNSNVVSIHFKKLSHMSEVLLGPARNFTHAQFAFVSIIVSLFMTIDGMF